VVDYRNIPAMQAHRVPVIMDVTHALQQPNQTSGVTGGNPQLIGTIAQSRHCGRRRMDCSLKTHPDPFKSIKRWSDMLKLKFIGKFIATISKVEKSCH